MANCKSAEKRNRQAIIRRDRNRAQKSRLKSSIKGIRAAVEAGDSKTAQELLPSTLSLLDVTAQSKVIHPNAAARSKSRLIKLVRTLEQA